MEKKRNRKKHQAQPLVPDANYMNRFDKLVSSHLGTYYWQPSIRGEYGNKDSEG